MNISKQTPTEFISEPTLSPRGEQERNRRAIHSDFPTITGNGKY